MLLVCRNSTDTAYFQRLRPYPRVMLRRGNARFKDYDKTPIGFGVAVFCIAKAPCKCAAPPLYTGAPLQPAGTAAHTAHCPGTLWTANNLPSHARQKTFVLQLKHALEDYDHMHHLLIPVESAR